MSRFAGPLQSAAGLGKGEGIRSRFVAGDPLRAVAAISVLTGHVYLAARPSMSDGVLTRGGLGVYLFFVLSGYLISRPFVQSFVDAQPAPGFRPYARNRLLRIVPAFWVVAALVLLRVELDDRYADGTSLPEALAIFGFGQVFDPDTASVIGWELGPAWSLHSELVFYLFVPLVAFVLAHVVGRRLGRNGRLALVLALAGAALFLSLAARGWLPETSVSDRMFYTNAFAFMPGVALAALEPFARSVARGWRYAWGVAAGALTVGLVVLFMAPDQADSPGWRGAFIAVGITGVVGAALLLEWSGRRPWRLLDNRPLHWLGERSYAIYLLHVPVIAELVLLEPGRRWNVAVLWLVTMVLVCLGAALSWRFVEQPFLRLRARPAETGSGRAGPPLPEPGLEPVDRVDRQRVEAVEHG